jgi:hypothetical protein
MTITAVDGRLVAGSSREDLDDMMTTLRSLPPPYRPHEIRVEGEASAVLLVRFLLPSPPGLVPPTPGKPAIS